MAQIGTDQHTPGEKLTATQARGLAALLKERDVRAAAKAAKVGERTFWSWMKLPQFRAALDDAVSEVIDGAILDLGRLAHVASGTLYRVMVDEDAAPSARVQAANVVLTRLILLHDFKNYTERFAAIEAALGIKDK